MAEVRERYRAKRDVLLPALLAAGLEPAGGEATFFLWLRVPGGDDAEPARCACSSAHGIVVAPGPFFGPGGAGHVRVALVPDARGLPARGRAPSIGRMSAAPT